jgi:hypothetical protein
MTEQQADAAFLVSGATLDDESVGPLYADAAEAHRLARTVIAGVGGTVRILRDSPGGWLEVARYTDTGQYMAGRRSSLGVWFPHEDEPIDWADERRPFSLFRGWRG